jgi:integrase
MALTALHKLQLRESADAGTAYQSGLVALHWYQGGEYVIADELGKPVHPEWYSDEFGRLLRRAGLRRITLHDSRHTTLTLMEHAGVPISIISKWAGHYELCVHPEDLRSREQRRPKSGPHSARQDSQNRLASCEKL